MLQNIKGFFQIIFCTAPATTISEPDKFEIFQVFGFNCDGFVTTCRFIQFGTTACIKVCLYSINGIFTLYDKVKPFLCTTIIGY